MIEKERITKSIQEFGEDAKCGHHGNLLNGKPCPDCFPEFYEQRQEPVSLKRIVIGTGKKIPKAGEAVLAKITIPSKTMGYFYAVVYHNGNSWLPQENFQYGNKIIDFKPVEECL